MKQAQKKDLLLKQTHSKILMDSDNIAYLELDQKDKSSNVLSSDFMQELKACLDHLENNNSVTALIVYSLKEKQFIAGADLNEISAIKDQAEAYEKSRQGQDVFKRIENLPYQTIVCIDGACLGGGLELALSCNYRIGTNQASFALPEVKLGILPGWGGTQRLPKLLGLKDSLAMILSGKTIFAKKALKIGLIDDMIHTNKLLSLAKQIALKTVTIKQKKASFLVQIFEKVPFLRKQFFYNKAQKSLKKFNPEHYPAPHKALQVIEETYLKSNKIAYEVEAQALAQLLCSKASKHFVQMFFSMEGRKKSPFKSKPKDISLINIIGAGTMGGGLAQLFAYKKFKVRLQDIHYSALEKAMQTVSKLFKKLIIKKRITKSQALQYTHAISTSTQSYPYPIHDFVLEAIVEDLDLKLNVLVDLEKNQNKDCIIASNTSALSITQLAASLKRPSQFVGMHFFNPVSQMPLVEIIRHDKVSQKTLSTVYDLALKLGKTPIVVNDGPGFLVNRILGIYLNEALIMAQEGIDIQVIDTACKKFGLPMGPFELMDEVGLDVAYKVSSFLSKKLLYFPQTPKDIETLIQNKHLGKKSGMGFYVYSNKTSKKHVNTLPFKQDLSKISKQSITQRLMFLMVNEAARCLENDIVDNTQDLDLAMILGIGFPPFTGGLCAYAKELGIETIQKELKIMSLKHGEHFEPSPYLKQL